MTDVTPAFNTSGSNTAAASRAAASAFLKSKGIKFKPGPGGLLVVEGNIKLEGQNLRLLPDLSQVAVKGNFSCANNDLTSLKGAPCSVGGIFDCSGNQGLESLEYAPGMVSGNMYCTETGLTSLEGCPQNFAKLYTGFGTYESWDEVPQKLRISPASLAKDATTLGSTVNIHRPLSFKMGAGAAVTA